MLSNSFPVFSMSSLITISSRHNQFSPEVCVCEWDRERERERLTTWKRACLLSKLLPPTIPEPTCDLGLLSVSFKYQPSHHLLRRCHQISHGLHILTLSLAGSLPQGAGFIVLWVPVPGLPHQTVTHRILGSWGRHAVFYSSLASNTKHTAMFIRTTDHNNKRAKKQKCRETH